jgi:predicted O-methyltransferase YrrM
VEEYEYRHVDSKPALSARSFDEFLQELAHSLLHRPKHRNRVEIIVGSALEILHELTTSVQQGTRQPFDFFFIDADKENNYEYVDFACQLASPGACVIVDNMVRRGELARDDLDDPKVAGNRRLVEKPRGDGRIDAVVMQVVGEKNYDGFLMGVVKEGVKKGK